LEDSESMDNTDIDFGLDFRTPKGDLSNDREKNDLDESVFIRSEKKSTMKLNRCRPFI